MVEHAAHTRSVLGSSPRTAILLFKEVYIKLSSLFEKILKDQDVKNLFNPRDKLIIALSGGPDSVFLLHFLLYLQKRLDFELSIAHLNHSLRGEESDKDAHFVRKLALENDLSFVIEKIDVKEYAEKEKLSIESAARALRYKFLLDAALKFHCNKIALAHTLDDLVETFLMRLARGTGIQGLIGIPMSRMEKDIALIRPLLKVPKEEILSFLEKNRISYMVDSTNYLTKYLRNFIRHNIVPQFLTINPKFRENLLNLTSLFQELEEYLSPQIDHTYKNISIKVDNNLIKINLDKFLSLPTFLQTSVLKKAISSFLVYDRGIYHNHLIDILKFIKNHGEKDYTLPFNIKVKKSYIWLFLYKGTPKLFQSFPNFCFKLNMDKEINIETLGVSIYMSINKDLDTNDFDIIYKLPYNVFYKALYIRNRRKGDRIGHKKIKEIFIANKIPRYLRDKIPLIVSGKNDVKLIIGVSRPLNISGNYFIIGVKFKKGGLLWNELWKKY